MLLVLLILANGCGSGGGGSEGPAVFVGPELSMGEALQLEINHLYIKEWSSGGKTIYFSVYVQNSIYGNNLVCAGPSEGLSVASEAGTYYGKLSVPMMAVTGAVDNNPIEMKVIIVADQEEPCPAPPNEDDIVVSATVELDELVGTPIRIGADDAIITFKGKGHDDVDVVDVPALEPEGLAIGEIYFTDTIDETQIPSYYLTLYLADGSGIYLINHDEMPEMRRPQVIYSWLELIFDGLDDSTLNKNGWVVLNRLSAEGPVIIGQTESVPLKDMYGRRFEFTNDRGYIKFRDIN